MRFLIILLLGVTGCSTWKATEQAAAPRLPQTRMSPDSVGVEVATVTLDADNFHLLEGIVAELDEQVIDPETRRHLAQNGFRGGLLGQQLPSEVQLLLLEAADRREHPTAETVNEFPDQQRFIQCRPDKKVCITLWGSVPRLAVKHNDGELIVTEELLDAACKFGLRCKANGPDGTTVTLIPEIEHGQLKHKYVVDGSSFHIEARRDEQAYDDLKTSFFIRSGETLLLTCNEAEDLVGQTFFRNSTRTKQKLLLVRLAQTQVHVKFED